METSLSVSISTKSGERIWHCAKLTSLDYTCTLVQFPTRLWLKSPVVQIRRCWQLTPSHARCWRVKKGHKHLCVPEGNRALNMFLQPCSKIWPFRKAATYFEKKIKLKKNLHHFQSVPLHPQPLCPSKVPFGVSKCLESSNSGGMFKYVALLFPILRS